jgi:PKD domain
LLSQKITGPSSSLQLFSITFNVTGPGASRFFVDEANLVNPYGDPSNPQQLNPQFIPVLEEGGVFGNTGVVAFFNFQPSNPSVSPSILPNNPNDPALFDASGSFVPNDTSDHIQTYSWNFGDGTTGVGVTVTHVFREPENYTVSLTVYDSNGKMNETSRLVPVVPALGSITLTVEDQSGTAISGSVVVQLFNTSSSTTPFASQSPNEAGGVTFDSLTPHNYTLTFSGGGFEDASKTETVIPGWTTMDTIYLTQIPPSQNNSGLIYAGAIVAASGAFAGALIYQRRKRAKKLAKSQTSAKAKK